MAKYEVIKDFTDLEDNNHIYLKGDKFPERVKQLKSELKNFPQIKTSAGSH